MTYPENRSKLAAFSDWFNRVTYYAICIIGTLTLSTILAILVLWGFFSAKNALDNPPVYSGTVTAVRYDDGHPWYSSYVFGDWKITRTHSSDHESYWMLVDDGRHTEWWEIDLDQYCDIQIGAQVSKW